MKLGLMQPYFMPYIGYWQRIKAVDRHVIYDDVNYIKNGWMNHNRILLNGNEHLLTIPLVGASPNKLINEVAVNNDPRLQDKMLKTLEQGYKKSKCFNEAMACLLPIIRNPETNLAEYLAFQIREICKYMGIMTRLLMSSSIEKDNALKGRDKVIAICKSQGAEVYYNALSGDHLYDKDDFAREGIQLVFIRDRGSVQYVQRGRKEFFPSLSIIDVLMSCDLEEINMLLDDYELL